MSWVAVGHAPMYKYITWKIKLEQAQTAKSISNNTQLSILGRLENVATLVVPMGHFLNNIRALQTKAAERKHNVCMK